jgi:hypothetical protein
MAPILIPAAKYQGLPGGLFLKPTGTRKIKLMNSICFAEKEVARESN